MRNSTTTFGDAKRSRLRRLRAVHYMAANAKAPEVAAPEAHSIDSKKSPRTGEIGKESYVNDRS